MATALPLRAALRRGALVTLANWPIVVIDFVVESLYKLALGVPIVGGAFMVAVLVGDDVRSLFAEGVRAAAEQVVASLTSAPVALVTFLLAVGLVAFAGSLAMFYVKAGTLAVLVNAERGADDIERPPVRLEIVRRAYRYDIGAFLRGISHFGRRAMVLAGLLSVSYFVIGLSYLVAMALAVKLAEIPGWASAWPIVVLVATSIGVVAIAIVNLAFDLLRIVITADDCSVRASFDRLRSFLVEDSRQVLGLFGVVAVLLMLATAASILATAGLALVAWVPFVGLIVVPLQAAAWLVRGLVFQYLGLTALGAYLTQYRRFAEPSDRPGRPVLVQHA